VLRERWGERLPMREWELIQRPPVLVSLLVLLNLHGLMMTDRVFLLLAAFVLPLVFVGCDATGGADDTATFNVENTFRDEEPPVAEYLFEYDSDNQVDGQELVEVTSGSSDNLGDALRGFTRSDIVSAAIDSVNFIRLSPDGKTKPVMPIRG